MRHVVFLAACILLCCGFSDHQVLAQDDPPKLATESVASRRGPLPFYYGKLGMNDEQRRAAYDVMDSYDTKIETLKKQLKSLLEEREEKLQSTLTPGQKLRLKELMDDARKKAGVTEENPEDN